MVICAFSGDTDDDTQDDYRRIYKKKRTLKRNLNNNSTDGQESIKHWMTQNEKNKKKVSFEILP